MKKLIAQAVMACSLGLGLPAGAAAQPSHQEMNAANNPLTPTVSLNLQDNYVGRYYGLGDEDGNNLLLRGTLPHKLFGLPQMFRFTMPVVTTPAMPAVASHTGAGDLNVFDLFLGKFGGVEVGLGPQLTLPTASRDETGTGKWQAGVAAVVIAPQKWGLIGGLLTWQHSFADDDERPTQNNAQLQPFFIYNLPEGWYLRSTATWSFDFERHTHYIPIGLGVGKVIKSGRDTFNVFAEPQWTVDRKGDGVPKFQVFMGLNYQFPL